MRVDKKWIRNPSDGLAIAEGCWFDEEAGAHVCRFIERFCRQSKGRWAGQPIVLLDWQRDFLMRLFGWRRPAPGRPNGLRRFRRFYLEVAKKNGKSTLMSAMVLYLLLADSEGAPEVYINAVDKEQASIVFDEAARMVRASPELDGRLDVIDSRKRIVDPKGYGKLVANSADVPSKDGVNASAWIFDELHRQKTRDMWEIFEYAGESREQPLAGTITTAGEDTDGVWHEQRVYSEQVNEGLIPDTTHLGAVYRALPTDDIDDPATWRKANPSLGATLDEGRFAAALAEAKEVPSKLANFLRLRLNIVTGSLARFVSVEAWAACGERPSVGGGADCYLGLDMSSKIDLTSLVAVFPDDDNGFDCLAWFWTPAERLVERERGDGASYRVWAKAGHMTICDGGEVGFADVKKKILELNSAYRVRRLGADPQFCGQLLQELQEEEDMRVMEVRQTMWSLAYPTAELERLVTNRKLRHGGHPVLAWNAANAVARKDTEGRMRLDKKKSKKRIDGMAALVDAIAAASDGSDAGADSPYNERGLLVL